MAHKQGKPGKADRELQKLRAENDSLRAELEEAKETLNAIRGGVVDALVIDTPEGQRVFSLEGAERPYRAIIEQMQEAAVTVGDDGTILYCNLAFAEMLKRPLELVAGSRLETHIVEADRAKFHALMREGHSRSVHGELGLSAQGGGTVPVHVGLTRVVEAGEASVCMVATDLSERKRYEQRILQLNQELEERVMQRTAELTTANLNLAAEVGERKRQADAAEQQRQLLAVTLASIGDAVIATDVNGRVSFMNAEAERLTRWQGAAAQGQPLPTVFRIVNEETRQSVENPVDKVLRLGTVVGLANHTVLIGRDGHETPIDDSAALIRKRDGSAHGVVLVFRDFSERKSAEKALRESEERFRTMADAMPQLAWIAHADGYIHWYNRRWYEYTGTTPQRMEGWGWQSVHDPKMLPTVLERWKASITSGEPFEMEFPLRGADGHFRRFLTRGVPLKDTEGRVVQWFGTNTDVEELKQAGEELRKSEDRYRTLFETLAEGFCVVEVLFDANERPFDYRFLEANPAFEQQMGLHDVVGKRMRDLSPDEDSRWYELYGKVAVTGETTGFVSGRAALNRWYDGTAYRVGGPDSRRVAIIFNDVSEIKQGEEEVQRLNRTLTALSKSSQAIARAKQETDYLKEVCRIIVEDCGHAMVWIGYAEADEARSVRPVAWWGFEEGYLEALQITWGDDERGRGPTGTAIRSGQVNICPNIHTDPRLAPWRDEAVRRGYRSSIALPLLREGRAFGAITIYGREDDPFTNSEVELLVELSWDVAHGIDAIRVREARDRAEADLLKAKDAAEAASKAKDHFMAVLSHELRNPLTPVLASLSGLEKIVPAEGSEYLEIARRNVELEARLIDDLLDVTRITRGKIELERGVVEVCTILRHAAQVCKPDIEARGLHFGIEVKEGPHPVYADAARLQQVFWNLIKNAVKFTPQGGSVGVRVWREDGRAMVEVTDSGEGIEPQALDRIFNAFEQETRSTTRQFGGLGLGLAISKALVELHGGAIRAHSEGKGRGATFTVELLIHQAQAGAGTRSDAGAKARGAARKLRILVVEDHGDTARVLVRLLSAQGHTVKHAGDVATALALAEAERFDVLLSDLGLPDGTGHDLMRQLVKAGKRVPAIALSGYGMADDVRQSHEAGFMEHVTKPVKVESLMAALDRVTNV